SLHATAEHFRPTGEFGNVADREAGFTQSFGAAAGGKNLDAQRGELLGEIHESCFVENAYERALHRHVLPPEKHISVSVARFQGKQKERNEQKEKFAVVDTDGGTWFRFLPGL